MMNIYYINAHRFQSGRVMYFLIDTSHTDSHVGMISEGPVACPLSIAHLFHDNRNKYRYGYRIL